MASPTPPATVALLRALTALGPRLRRSTAARDPQALYALVCDTLRASGLFAHVTHAEPQSIPADGDAGLVTDSQRTLRIVATSIGDEMRAGIEALIGTAFIGYPVAVAGPYQTVVQSGEPVFVERLVEILAPIVPQLSPEQRAQLAQLARADQAILAAIVSGGAVCGVLSVWGPGALLGAEDALVVAALAAQLGVALENARLLTEAERESNTQRRMQREIAAHASQVEATFDAMVDAVALYDGEGKVLRANAACRLLLGLDQDPRYDQRLPAERMARLSARTSDGRPLPAMEWPMMRLLRGETIAEENAGDFLVNTLDGREILLSPSGAPVRDASGAIIGAVAVYRDVTERRRLERELRRRAGELESIFESITDGVMVYGPRGEIKYLNRAYRAMLALSDEEMERLSDARGRAIFPRRPRTGEEMPREEWPSTRIMAGESLTGASSVDILVRAHDGRELLINCTGAPVRAEQGAIVGAVMVIRDVGERRRLEQRAQEALSALLAMAEALVRAPMETPTTAPAGMNDVASIGTRQSHAQQLDTEHAMPFAERDATQRLADLTLRVLNCRHVSIVALSDPRALRPADVPAAPDAAFGQRIFGVAIAGFPPEHVRDWWRRFGAGVPVELLATPEQLARLRAGESFFAQPRARVYRGEEFGISTELWAPLRSGNQLIGAMAVDYGDNPDTNEPVERRLTPQDQALAEAVGKLVALVIERERLLREREEARASELALRQANERLDTFISLASHELRTPLTTIMANAQIALRRAQSVAEEAKLRGFGNAADVEKLAHVLERTQVAAERQNRLVGDLLDVSRIHAGKLELRPESLDLAELLTDAVEEQRLAYPERAIKVRLPGERVVVTADGERIRQVVANYLTNALKYAPASQPIEVSLSREADAARVQVRDRGPGIAVEEQERIWERFYRAPGVEHQSGSGIGLGLGLYICRQIVERHGGTVGVESERSRGSIFFFTLPISG